MVFRPNVSSKILQDVGTQLTKSVPRTSIPIPKSLQRFTSDDQRPTGRANSPGIKAWQQRGHPSTRSNDNDLASLSSERTNASEKVTKPNGKVEAFIEKEAPLTYGFSVNPLMESADLLFKKMPAYLYRTAVDPATIFKLLPTINKLLPQDPNPGIQSMEPTHGVRDLRSWTLSGELGRGLPSLNAVHLGFTLAMYPTIMDPSSLLFDGTDNRFLPGPPEVWRYRVWSGGFVRHCVELPPRLMPNSALHHVLERPVNVTIANGAAKVTIRKTIMPYIGKRLGVHYTGPGMLKLVGEEPTSDLTDYNGPYAVEEYKLAFFKTPPKSLSEDYSRFIKAPKQKPEFSHTLRFDRHHLFCWSSVTQNAHLIHLDSEFAKKEYNAKDLVVQGPFTVFLILEWLRRVITAKALFRLDKFAFTRIDYKIIAPIFVDELVRFCARPLERAVPGSISHHWHIWAEKPNPQSPEDSILTFTAKVTVHTESWTGRVVSPDTEVEGEGVEAEEPSWLEQAADEAPAEDFPPNTATGPGRDDFASQGFSSPFFSR